MKKSFCEERSAYDWTNKEKSKSLDKPTYSSTKKEDKEKEKKDSKREVVVGAGETESETREKRSSKGKYGTNEMLESDNPPPEYKSSDYMVIDITEAEVRWCPFLIIIIDTREHDFFLVQVVEIFRGNLFVSNILKNVSLQKRAARF